MLIRAVIIEDEDISIKLLTHLFNHFPQVKVVGTAKSVAAGVKVIKENDPNLVLLDVNIPGQNGFELLRKFDRRSFEVVVASGEDHAIEAYKSDAIDYLLKPFNLEDIEIALQKVEKRLSTHAVPKSGINTFDKIGIPTRSSVVFVKPIDIIRCEGLINYTKIYLRSGEIMTCARTLLEFERQLSAWNFFRVHKSHLINLNCITSFIRGAIPVVTMDDNTSLNVSRRSRDELMKRLLIE